jgi:hypothetical protein
MLGQLPAPPGSAGFPSSYPYAYSGPLPSAILRPLQQPLYDTELTTAAGTPNMIQLFQRQLGQTTAAGALVPAPHSQVKHEKNALLENTITKVAIHAQTIRKRNVSKKITFTMY